MATLDVSYTNFTPLTGCDFSLMRRFDLLATLRLPPGDLRLLFLSLFLWTFGLGLYSNILVIFLKSIGADSSQIGIFFLLGFLVSAFTMIPGGLLANRYDLKTLIILSWASSIPAPIIYYFAQSWPWAIPGYIALQVGGFAVPAINAYITTAARKGRVSSAFGSTYSAAPLGAVLSPAVGSLLLTWLSIRDLFLISAVIFTVSTLTLLPMRPQPPLPQESDSEAIELPRGRDEKVLLIYIVAAALAWSITQPFLPLYYQAFLSLTAPQIQLAGAIQSLGAVTLSILLGSHAEHAQKGNTIALGLLMTTAGLLPLIFLSNPLLVIPFIFLAGGGRSPGLVAYSAISGLQRKSSRGGRFALYLTLENLGLGIGPYLGGILYGISPASTLAITSTAFIALAGFASREIRE